MAGRRLGERHRTVAASLSNIGTIFHKQGDSGKALEYQKQALEIRMEAEGRESEAVASSLCRIGCHYVHLGEVNKGLKMLQEGPGIKRRIRLGEDDEGVASALMNIALDTCFHNRRPITCGWTETRVEGDLTQLPRVYRS